MSLLLACLISLRASWTCIGASAHVQPVSSPAFHCLSGQSCRKYPASFKFRGGDAGRQDLVGRSLRTLSGSRHLPTAHAQSACPPESG